MTKLRWPVILSPKKNREKELKLDNIEFPISLFNLLVESDLCQDKFQGQKLIKGKAVRINGSIVYGRRTIYLHRDQLRDKVLSVGRKEYIKLV